jgi:Mlc titration factor MtfA (ptsG expression regulator)
MQAVAYCILIGAVLLLASAWLWGPHAAREWRRARIRRQPFPPAWREVLRRRMPYFASLPADLQLQLKKLTQVFIAEKPFIGCRGLVVTEEMRVLVAAQASLLQLNRNAGGYPNLREVLIYPGAFIVDQQRSDAIGLVSEERRVLSGQSWQRGQVLLSWNDVLAGAADPGDGHNVVIHEFAHQLDQERGAATGAPFLGRRDRLQRWAATLSAAYENLRQRVADGEDTLIDAYGATEPAEFFAVVSEVFFERPLALAAEQPALYRELAGCYRVDPLSWQ